MLPATFTSIKQAFQEINPFCIDAWEGDYRPADWYISLVQSNARFDLLR